MMLKGQAEQQLRLLFMLQLTLDFQENQVGVKFAKVSTFP